MSREGKEYRQVVFETEIQLNLPSVLSWIDAKQEVVSTQHQWRWKDGEKFYWRQEMVNEGPPLSDELVVSFEWCAEEGDPRTNEGHRDPAAASKIQ